MIIEEVYFEDYHIGSERTTFGRTITEADVVFHAGQTGDNFPHHMDKEWCATQEFGERIAHGTLIFSVAVGMTASTINPVAMSYGYDKLRFVKPVFIGDTITVRARISDKQKHPKRQGHGLVYESLSVTKQNGETVLVCDHIYLVKSRSAETSG